MNYSSGPPLPHGPHRRLLGRTSDLIFDLSISICKVAEHIYVDKHEPRHTSTKGEVTDFHLETSVRATVDSSHLRSPQFTLHHFDILATMSSTDQKMAELHSQLFEEGLEVRRAVLGSEYVDNAVKNATPFTRPGQELITEWAWGTIWKRPGLDRKQRSLLSKCESTPPPPLRIPRGIINPPSYTLPATPSRARFLQQQEDEGEASGDSTIFRVLSCLRGRNAEWVTPANQCRGWLRALCRFGDNYCPEGMARACIAHPRRHQQRPHRGRDQGGCAAGNRLLRHACWRGGYAGHGEDHQRDDCERRV